MCTLTPTLCEHTTPSPSLPDLQLPKSRLEIIRHFSFQSHTATVELSFVDDIFDLRVPKLQIYQSNGSHNGSNVPSESSAASDSTGITDTSADEEKKALKREIKSWWQGVAEHIDRLVSHSIVYKA
jgi:1-phosphatidylinositol-3-phosphate 5-kinase